MCPPLKLRSVFKRLGIERNVRRRTRAFAGEPTSFANCGMSDELASARGPRLVNHALVSKAMNNAEETRLGPRV